MARKSITITAERSIAPGDFIPITNKGSSEIVTGNEKSPLSRAAIIDEISQVDNALKDMCESLDSPGAFVSPIEISAMAAKSTILKQRADLLHKLLNKTMADKKAPTPKSPLAANSHNAIPIEVLQRIILGQLSDDELDIYRAALENYSE